MELMFVCKLLISFNYLLDIRHWIIVLFESDKTRDLNPLFYWDRKINFSESKNFYENIS